MSDRIIITIILAAVLALLIPLACCDVTISNSYYLDNDQVSDQVYLDNAGYDSSVDIDPQSIIGSSSSTSSGNGVAEFFGKIALPGNGLGAYLQTKGVTMSNARSFTVDPIDGPQAGISYEIKNGDSLAGVYSPQTAAQQSLQTNGFEYSGALSIQPSGVNLVGSGERTMADTSQGTISQKLYLQHKGTSAETDLSMFELAAFRSPLNFQWQTHAGGIHDGSAASALDLVFIPGERFGMFNLVGRGDIPVNQVGFISAGTPGVDEKEHWWLHYNIN